MNWTVDGTQRQALVFAPAQLSAAKAHMVPLLFAFHGHGDTMQNAARAGHLETLWPEAIVVFPQGLPDPWDFNAGWQGGPGRRE